VAGVVRHAKQVLRSAYCEPLLSTRPICLHVMVSVLLHCRSTPLCLAVCVQVTRQVLFTQYFVNVPATALRGAAAQLRRQGQTPPLGQLLRFVEEQTVRTCDVDAGPYVWVLGARLQRGMMHAMLGISMVAWVHRAVA